MARPRSHIPLNVFLNEGGEDAQIFGVADFLGTKGGQFLWRQIKGAEIGRG